MSILCMKILFGFAKIVVVATVQEIMGMYFLIKKQWCNTYPFIQVSLSVSLMLTALEIWFQPQVKDLAVLTQMKVSPTMMELLVFHA